MSAPRTAAAPWLLADLGGTNVRFALGEPRAAEPLVAASIRTFPVAGFAGLAEAAQAYLAQCGAQPAHFVLALAGPVRGSEVQLTNLAWRISASALERALGLQSVRLVNDFAATGMCLPLLAPADVTALGPRVEPIVARPQAQTFCVLGPGTGLGVSALTVRDGAIASLETEGGHASFAPVDDTEIAVWRLLVEQFGRVSHERVLCGSGLVNLYRALCALDGAAAEPLAPEEVSARARAASDTRCARAASMFCDMLGTLAGDLVLTFGAWDGVYLAGGLLAPLAPWLAREGFRRRFEDKGRFASAMRAVPAALITHSHPGLLGAAGLAVIAAGGRLLHAAAPAAR